MVIGMKTAISVLISLLLIFSFAGCSPQSQEPAAAPADNTADPADAADAPSKGTAEKVVFFCNNLGDMSISDDGQRGMERLRDEYGYEIQTVETGPDPSKYESYIADVCESGAHYIIVSSLYQEQAEKLSTQYPDVGFVIYDVDADQQPTSDNILYAVFAPNEGSYLIGMVGAAMSKSGVIGCVGGMQIPIISDFMTGYIQGARSYNPDIKVAVSWVGNWTDSPKMLELCTQQNNIFGADFFFPIAGGAGLGAFEAAANIGGIWTSGVDSDQHALFASENNPLADVIVTSMLKKVGESFVSIFSDLQKGQEYWGTVKTYGIAESSIGYVNNKIFTASVPEDVQKAVAQAEADIKSGKLDVMSYFDFASEQEFLDYVAEVAP